MVNLNQSVTNARRIATRFIRELYIKEPPSQNFRLTDLCLTYLTFDCLKHDLGEDEVQQSVLNGDYSFLEYAANNWLSHLKELDSDRCRLDPEQCSNIQKKTKAVLDFHQLRREQDYTPRDIARYFQAFADCPEVYNHPALMCETGFGQGSGEGLSPDISIVGPLTPDTCQNLGGTPSPQIPIRSPGPF